MNATDDTNDDVDNVEQISTAATDTAKQISSGNTDGLFEPGVLSPFDKQGRLRWTAERRARGAAAVMDASIRAEEAGRHAQAERQEQVRDELRARALQGPPGWKDS